MARTTTAKIADVQEQIRQLENRHKELRQQAKEEERKARTHRICKRGGLLESLLPETIPLTDEQFKAFLEKALLSDYSRRTLERFTAQGVTAPVSVPAGKEAVPAINTGAEQTESEVTAF